MFISAILNVDKSKEQTKSIGGKNGYSLNQPGGRMGMENSNGE